MDDKVQGKAAASDGLYDKPRTFGAGVEESEKVQLETPATEAAPEAEKTTGSVDNAAAMDAVLKAASVNNPNIKPIEFKDTIAAKKQSESTGGETLNVINANGIISGQKVVNGTWRTFAVVMVILFLIAAAGAGYLFYIYSSTEKDRSDLSEKTGSYSAKLESLYSVLGVSNQADALSIVNSEDVVLSQTEILGLKEALNGSYEISSIDFSREGTFIKRVGSYKVFSFYSGTDHVVAYAAKDGKWKMLSYSDTATHPCSDYTQLEQNVVDKALGCED